MLKLKKAGTGQIAESVQCVNGTELKKEFYYDHCNRLTCVRTDGVITEFYEYDSGGRRIKSTVHSDNIPVQREYVYNESGQLIQAGDTKYIYDQYGQLVSKITDKGVCEYGYLGGNLCSVQLSDG